MHPPSWLTGSPVLLVTLLSVGAAGAQEVRPGDPALHVHQLTITNGSVPTVAYFVQGGSPHQQALYRSLQFTENELTVVEEVQRLRMVASTGETAGWSPGCGLLPGFSYPGYGSDFGYPAAENALQLIGLREEIQTELARPPAPQGPKAPQGRAGAAEKTMRALLQGRAAAPPSSPGALVPAFPSVCARLAVRPRLGYLPPYASTAIAGGGIGRGYLTNAASP